MTSNSKEASGRTGRVHVSCFGKHPGWDDHIEEIGLDTAALAQAKRLMYTEGLAGNIDSGAWEKLADAERLPGFAHQFYWRMGTTFIVGRMWSSRDGKGRAKYPMCVAATVDGAPESWIAAQCMPRLAAIEGKVTQTGSAELVRFAIGEARADLERAVAVGVSETGSARSTLVRKLLQSRELSGDAGFGQGEGLMRLVYEMDRELEAFRGKGRTKGLVKSQHLRVPRGLESSFDSAMAWMSVMEQEAPGDPVLLIEPLHQPWFDVIVGDPQPANFFCVRAGAKALAPVTEVPYTIEPGFRSKAMARAAGWEAGATQAAPTPEAAEEKGKSDALRNKILIAAGAAAVIAGIALLLLMRSGSSTPAPAPRDPSPQTKSEAAPEPSRPAKGDTDADAPIPAESTPPPAAVAPALPAGDPRANWGFDDLAARTEAQITRLERELSSEGKAADPSWRKRLDAQRQRSRVVRAITPSASTRDAVTRDMASIDEQMSTLSRDVTLASNELAGRILADLRGQGSRPGVKTEVMRRAWTTAVGTVSPDLGWQGARAKAAEFGRQLQEAEDKIGELPDIELAPGTMLDAGALRVAASTRRDEALQAAANAVLAGDALRVDQAAAGFRTWKDNAAGFTTEVRALENALNPTAASASPDTAAIGAAADRVRAAAAYKEFAPAVAPMLRLAQNVIDIQSVEDPNVLLESVASGAADPSGRRVGEAIAAWERLAVIDWPSTGEDLARAGTLYASSVREAARRAGDGPRAALEAASAKSAARMWLTFAEHASDKPEGVAAAIAQAPALGVGADMESRLSGRSQYNFARAQMARALEAAQKLSGEAKAKALREAAVAFTAKLNALPADVKAQVAPQAQSIQSAIEAASSVDLGKLGPGATGWRPEMSEDRERVTYIGTVNGKEHRVEFRRVAPPDAERLTYVATTEFPVGLFIDTMTQAGKWDDVRNMLAQWPSNGDDRRSGPRVWDWTPPANTLMRISLPGTGDTSAGWLQVRRGVSFQAYPAGTAWPAPAAASPMQYVSPSAAIMAARILNCRIPTSNEWKQAVASENGATEGANLRDQTWKRQYEHARTQTESLEWPASGIFRPTGSPRIATAADGEPATTVDDGVLWFAPANEGAGARFKHLVGNVAEFVFEDATALDALAGPIPEAIALTLGKGEKLRVIGASALSPVAQKPEDPQPTTAASAREGFSDVGFRLAFTAPRSTAATNAPSIEQALSAGSYLPKP